MVLLAQVRRLARPIRSEAPAPSGFPLAWAAILAGDPVALTDPLTNVTTSWDLVLDPAPATVRDR